MVWVDTATRGDRPSTGVWPASLLTKLSSAWLRGDPSAAWPHQRARSVFVVGTFCSSGRPWRFLQRWHDKYFMHVVNWMVAPEESFQMFSWKNTVSSLSSDANQVS
ncbi:unnamed protein product, partial [Hapterophycus canaliculatus]